MGRAGPDARRARAFASRAEAALAAFHRTIKELAAEIDRTSAGGYRSSRAGAPLLRNAEAEGTEEAATRTANLDELPVATDAV